jgi:DUF1680 family protein
LAELAKCQANNKAADCSTGYLSGFPESEFTALEGGKLTSGNVPYYVMHKMLAGLLDVWRHIGDTIARDVLLALAGWVDSRTAKLSASLMQSVLNTEFGGMNDVLANLNQETGDSLWITVRRASTTPPSPTRWRPTRTSSTVCTLTPTSPSGSVPRARTS